MAEVARVGIDMVDNANPRPILGTLQSVVLLGGVSVAIVGDPITPPPPGCTISAGNSQVKIGGVDVARRGDPTTCGPTIISGSSTVEA